MSPLDTCSKDYIIKSKIFGSENVHNITLEIKDWIQVVNI